MPETIFIAASEPGCGKTVLSVGLVANLKKMVDSVGYIKIIGHRFCKDSGIDEDVLVINEVLQNNDNPDDMCPTTFQEIRHNILEGNKDSTIRKILKAYKNVAKGKNVVVVEGTDHTEMSANMELNINADVAKAIGCKVLLVAKANNRTEEDILSDLEAARNSYKEKDCPILGAVVNNVSPEQFEDVNRSLRERLQMRNIPLLGVIPSSDLLPHPRLSDLVENIEGEIEVLHGGEYLENIAFSYIVGSMRPHNALEYFRDGCLVITAGDRDDIILSAIATHMAEGYPEIAGIVLTGGLRPEPNIMKLIDALGGMNIPILLFPQDTYNAVKLIENLHVHISRDDIQKINEASFLIETYVNVEEIFAQSHVTIQRKKTPDDFLIYLENTAAKLNKHIVFPEGTEPRIIKAAAEITERKLARISLIGPEEDIKQKARQMNVSLKEVNLIDPMIQDDRFKRYADLLFQKRKHKGMNAGMAADLLHDSIYFGTMMVETEDADGLVSGSTHSTANTIRPALQIIKTSPEVDTVSSVFFMLKGDKVFLYADCAIVENPSAQQLADIALTTIRTAETFNIDPYVAMLSFSTGDSAGGPMVQKVKTATKLALKKNPKAILEGPIQYDAAFDPEVAKVKYPDSRVAGKANIFIFPDLNSGNIAYKAVQREAGAIALGPILQGLRQPVNDLSRGCNVQDIIFVTAITAIQASILDGE